MHLSNILTKLEKFLLTSAKESNFCAINTFLETTFVNLRNCIDYKFREKRHEIQAHHLIFISFGQFKENFLLPWEEVKAAVRN